MLEVFSFRMRINKDVVKTREKKTKQATVKQLSYDF